MPGSRNSKSSRRSKAANKDNPRAHAWVYTLGWALFAAAVMAAAIAFFYKTGATLYYGDAEAHLDIARRVIDSRTPGWSQIGTTWLPLPHLLMIPLVRNDFLWRTGLAGGIASGAAMSIASAFLFASVQRICSSAAVASASAAVFLLNPNTLYLGSVPMTESFFFAALFALLYFTVRFGDTQGWGAAIGAGIAGFAAAFTRYEGWFLLPFVAVYILLRGGRGRWWAAGIFCAIAGLAPLLWLAHNRWYFGDPLYFYRGPWSALAIQGKSSYPGKSDWGAAVHYFFEAGRLIAGWPGIAIGGIGIAVLAVRRVVWPVVLLVLPAAFYVWSVHSSGTPIFVPTLWPHTFYNVRYGMALLPLVALGAAGVASSLGRRSHLALMIAFLPLVTYPLQLRPDARPVAWQEAETNSRARRQWVAAAATYLGSSAGPHETFFTSFGDLSAIYRTLGVPLSDTLTGDNDVQWDGAVARPDLLLHTDWAVAMGGDAVQTVVDKARLRGPRYELEQRFTVKGAPAIEIYRRIDESPIH
jgi:hypothetical protein